MVNGTMRLKLLAPGHAGPLEEFEGANRSFFAARVGDRGDDFFMHFDDWLASRILENQDGTSLLVVIVDAKGEVLGRINITDVDRPDATELGFRIAEHAQGRGLARTGVTEALEVAATRGVRTVKARVAIANPASHRVLEHCGFARVGRTESPSDSSQTFIGYHKDLDRTLGSSVR